jgi:hypothetical protein
MRTCQCHCLPWLQRSPARHVWLGAMAGLQARRGTAARWPLISRQTESRVPEVMLSVCKAVQGKAVQGCTRLYRARLYRAVQGCTRLYKVMLSVCKHRPTCVCSLKSSALQQESHTNHASCDMPAVRNCMAGSTAACATCTGKRQLLHATCGECRMPCLPNRSAIG